MFKILVSAVPEDFLGDLGHHGGPRLQLCHLLRLAFRVLGQAEQAKQLNGIAGGRILRVMKSHVIILIVIKTNYNVYSSF